MEGLKLLKEIISLVKNRGFSDTFSVLIKNDGFIMDMHKFYEELNSFSYYNSFLRIKGALIKKGIIEIAGKDIILTRKGLELYHKLKEINDLVID